MSQDLDRLPCKFCGTDTEAAPCQWPRPFKLLGDVPETEWKFGPHLQNLRRKAEKRLEVITKVGNASWGVRNQNSPDDSPRAFGKCNMIRTGHYWQPRRSAGN